MSDLKWRGCGEGSYVSHDGRFLIAQVEVPGKKGPKKAWALYGRVVLQSEGPAAHPPHPWGWSEEPLTVGATKGECQRVAAVSDYEVPVVGLHVIAPEERPNASTRGYSDCIECGVHFDRDDKHRYGDYCGRNCAEDAAGRLMDLIGQGIKLKDIDGRPLRIGPARPNEPDFRPD